MIKKLQVSERKCIQKRDSRYFLTSYSSRRKQDSFEQSTEDVQNVNYFKLMLDEQVKMKKEIELKYSVDKELERFKLRRDYENYLKDENENRVLRLRESTDP